MLSAAGLRITTNHIFSATLDDNNVLKFFTRVSDLAQHPPVYGLIMNPSFTVGGDGNRKELLKSLRLNQVLYKGLPGYKQVMMHKNYLPFIPDNCRGDLLYCQPSKEVLDAEEKDKKERKQHKKKKEMRKWTY
jgi:hypothetical protein